MRLSLSLHELVALTKRQIDFFDSRAPHAPLESLLDVALQRYELCLANIAVAGYSCDGDPYFDHLHGDQSAAFLYLCANSAWRHFEDQRLASRFFLLNKMRNGIVVMYDTVLPEVFLLNHTIGTVLGKATYGNYFVAYQNVTVGTDLGMRPVLGNGVVMYTGASILGRCTIGSGVTMGAGATLRNADVAEGNVVSGRSPHHAARPRRRDLVAHYFKNPLTGPC